VHSPQLIGIQEIGGRTLARFRLPDGTTETVDLAAVAEIAAHPEARSWWGRLLVRMMKRRIDRRSR
jgi:hypothetical protein